MPVFPLTHVLGLAAANWRQTDSALAAEARGLALDAELAALDTVSTCADLRALGHRVGLAAGHDYASGRHYAAIRRWEGAAMARIQARARDLFPNAADAAWVRDLHPPVGP